MKCCYSKEKLFFFYITEKPADMPVSANLNESMLDEKINFCKNVSIIAPSHELVSSHMR